MKKTILALLVLSAMLCNCSVSNQKQETPPPQEVFNPIAEGYKLFWEDNFEGTELDTSKWKAKTNHRRIGYEDASMVKVKDGQLHLMFDIRNDSIMAGALNTIKTFRTTYGYFECRAQLQRGMGPWAAFWLYSSKMWDGEDPGIFGAEIDIFEYRRELGFDHITHAVHWDREKKSAGSMGTDLPGLSEGFHTFALEWTPEKYVFYVDGIKFHETNKGLSHVDEFIILSMEIPSKLERIKNATVPDAFIVDYVRVYKK